VYLLLITLALAWRWPWAGALLFTAFRIWYAVVSWGPYPLIANLIGVWPLAGPALLVGLLFLFSWLYGAKLRPAV
jgi:hypothetical protein